MGFKVLVNGTPVFDEPAQVLEVAIQTAQGEKFRFGTGDLGAIDLVLKTVQAGDPVRLDQLDAAREAFNRGLVTGQSTGTPPPEFNPALLAKQGVSDSTLVPGAGSPASTSLSIPPVTDLSQGLTIEDTLTRTARIEEFNKTGDSEAAVAKFPPFSVTETPEAEDDPVKEPALVGASTAITEATGPTEATPTGPPAGPTDPPADFGLLTPAAEATPPPPPAPPAPTAPPAS